VQVLAIARADNCGAAERNQAVEDATGTIRVAGCLALHQEVGDLVRVAACALSSLLLHSKRGLEPCSLPASTRAFAMRHGLLLDSNRQALEESGLLEQVWQALQRQRHQRDVQLYTCGIVSSLAFDNGR